MLKKYAGGYAHCGLYNIYDPPLTDGHRDKNFVVSPTRNMDEAEGQAITKAGGKTQLGLAVAVALMSLYIASSSVCIHKAFHPVPLDVNATTTTTAAPPTAAPTNGDNRHRRNVQQSPPPTAPTPPPTAPTTPPPPPPTASPTVFLGSYAHEVDNLDDFHDFGTALMIVAGALLAISIIVFVVDNGHHMGFTSFNIDEHRGTISIVVLFFYLGMIIFTGYVTFGSAIIRPSLANLKETRTVHIDTRRFLELENTTDSVDNLCFSTIEQVTGQYDSAKHIVSFKRWHLVILVAFILVMGNLALQVRNFTYKQTIQSKEKCGQRA